MPLAPIFPPAAAAAAASPTPTPATQENGHHGDAAAGEREGVCDGEEEETPGAAAAAATAQREAPPAAVVRDFQHALEACRISTAGAAAAAGTASAEGMRASKSTLRLLDLLLQGGALDRVRSMFAVGGGGSSGGGAEDGGGSGAAAATAAEVCEEEATVPLIARPTEGQEWRRCVGYRGEFVFGEEGEERFCTVLYGASHTSLPKGCVECGSLAACVPRITLFVAFCRTLFRVGQWHTAEHPVSGLPGSTTFNGVT